MLREQELLVTSSLIDDIWLKIFNIIQACSHDDINVLAFASVSKQWRNVLFSIDVLKVNALLFDHDYGFNPTLFHRATSLKFNDTWFNRTTDRGKFYDLRMNSFLSQFMMANGKNLHTLHLTQNGYISPHQIVHFFKGVSSIILENDKNTDLSSLSVLDCLKHIKFIDQDENDDEGRFRGFRGVHKHLHATITRLLDKIDVVEYVGGNPYRWKYRTGKVIIHRSTVKKEYSDDDDDDDKQHVNCDKVIVGDVVDGQFIDKVTIKEYNDTYGLHCVYEGYVDSKHQAHGYGILTNHLPLSKTEALGAQYIKYEGEWKRNKFHGEGYMIYNDGSTYQGHWLNGRPLGKGLITWPSGDVYEGHCVHNQQHKSGVMKYANGNVYSGAWFNGKMNGKGEYSWINGDKYKGVFKDGKMFGKGKYLYKNGNRYVGYWLNNVKHGTGRFLDSMRNLVCFGDFVNGTFTSGLLYSQDREYVFDGKFICNNNNNDDNTLFKGTIYTKLSTYSRGETSPIDIKSEEDRLKYNLYDLTKDFY